MNLKEMEMIAAWIDEAIEARTDDAKLAAIKSEVLKLCREFPIYQRRIEAMENLLEAAEAKAI